MMLGARGGRVNTRRKPPFDSDVLLRQITQYRHKVRGSPSTNIDPLIISCVHCHFISDVYTRKALHIGFSRETECQLTVVVLNINYIF